MKLKPSAPLVEFLHAVQTCQGEVFFTTENGDLLNLKSQLAKYVFLAIASSEDQALVSLGEIQCGISADYALLQDFLLS